MANDEDDTDGLFQSKPKGPATLFKPHGSKSKPKSKADEYRQFSELRRISWVQVTGEQPPSPKRPERVRKVSLQMFVRPDKKELQKSISLGDITMADYNFPKVSKVEKKEEVKRPTTPQTFVYKPQHRRQHSRGRLTPTGSPLTQRREAANRTEDTDANNAPPPLPLPPKPKRSRKKSLKRAQSPGFVTYMDINKPKVGLANSIANISDDLGILRMRLLAVSVPHIRKFNRSFEFDGSDENDDVLPVPVELPLTDGLFCVFSISNKQARTESSLQPLQPKTLAAIWDNSESSTFFYVTPSHQLFVMSRKIPLADAKLDANDDPSLSRRPSAESMGVGIFPIKNLAKGVVDNDDGSVENWVETDVKRQEVRVSLEPTGNVLLEMSYYRELPPSLSPSLSHSLPLFLPPSFPSSLPPSTIHIPVHRTRVCLAFFLIVFRGSFA